MDIYYRSSLDIQIMSSSSEIFKRLYNKNINPFVNLLANCSLPKINAYSDAPLNVAKRLRRILVNLQIMFEPVLDKFSA